MTSRSTFHLTVDLPALQENYRLLAAKVGPSCQVAAVVKADCYGLGMMEIAPALEEVGCGFFYVAHLEEAIALRRITDKRIAVFNPVRESFAAEYAAHDLIPVLNSGEEVSIWGNSGPAIWHIDTGMNRLGMRPEEALALAGQAQNPALIMTHFACSDEERHEMNAGQVAAFDKVAQAFPGVPQSLCNSSAIFRNPAWRRDQVRPGIALYGGNPVPEGANPMRPVVRLETRVLQIRAAKAGETVGYGASATLSRDSLLAVVGLGYADGFLRSGSGRVSLYWNGKACPALGRVSMDLTAVDITDAGSDGPKVGSWLEVLGESQSVDVLAAAQGTISYEVLTSLGPRCRKAYLK